MLIQAFSVALLALLAAVEFGHVSVRLPFPPGVEYDYMADPPEGSLPPKWDKDFKINNEHLMKANMVLKDQITGVETVAVAPDGRLGLVDRFGKIFVAAPDGRGDYSIPQEPLAWSSPGRTTGVMFDEDGNLYIANAPLGLLQLIAPGDSDKQKLILATGRVSDESPLMAGFPVEFANSLDIAGDGTVYFSSSTDVLPYKTADGSWDVLDSVFVTMSKGAPAGMLLAYHPHNRSTIALMDSLWFANGVALAHDESYVLVADSIQCRIHKYWLKGPKSGTHELFMENLPGPPDGVSKAVDGRSYWVTIYSEVPGLVGYSNHRLVRVLLGWAPRIMRLFGAQIPKRGLVLKVGPQGEVVQMLGDAAGKVTYGVTSAIEADGKLFLGSIRRAGVSVLDLKDVQ